MSVIADAPARARALTELGSSLLVEAAAGTGKTSLLAARATLLLADGASPCAIAAITFTELAAGELAARVGEYVAALLVDATPLVLQPLLPSGLTGPMRANLVAAQARLDEMVATTIHGFCHVILRDHAVSVGFDPGVEVMDAKTADAAFETVFDRWLRTRFEDSAAGSDPIAVLAAVDPRGVVDLLRGLASLRRSHRSARPPPADLGGRPDLDLMEAVEGFRRWAGGVPREPRTLDALADLETLADFYAGTFAQTPDFARLWTLAHPPRVSIMRWKSCDLFAPKRRRDWLRVGGGIDGVRLADEAEAHFARAEACYATLLGRVGRALVAAVSDGVDAMLAAWDDFKRSAAVIDFDDLVEAARRIVRDHETARLAVAARFRHLLVDEFQDTDPVQAEVIFRIAAERPAARWQDAEQRPGALFLVGDPKQAVYAFRGADTFSYDAAKAALLARWPDALLELTSNFRSRPGICRHVDRCFAEPLSGPGRPNYAPLFPTRGERLGAPPDVSKLTLRLPTDARADAVREAEAAAVADLCARLVGSLPIDDGEGGVRLLGVADIALLTPTGTDLWRYERALTRRGLSVAPQAGKRLLHRQEVHDLMCLARVLADGGDTLAFGALMRGPLVGFTDERLLDVAEALRALEGGEARLTAATDPETVEDVEVREVLARLRSLRRRAGITTPFQILTEAAATFHVRAIVVAKLREASPGALANVDAFLEGARGYAVRGLVRFVQDLDLAWRSGASRPEGRADAEGGSIEIVTVHAAKGLEWPVTIPINTATQLMPRKRFFHRPSDDTLHWTVGDVVPPDLAGAVGEVEAAGVCERRRILYVAATRAREMVVVPRIAAAGDRTWAKVVDLRQDVLPEFELAWMPEPAEEAVPPAVNRQDAATFAREREGVTSSIPTFRWLRPSDRDSDRVLRVEVGEPDLAAVSVPAAPLGAGRLRGLVIHKLLEEILTSELAETLEVAASRAADLVRQLDPCGPSMALPEPGEMAATALSALALPAVAALRPGLVPEVAIRAVLREAGELRPVDGRADAVFVDSDGSRVIVDWKSDVAPSPAEIAFHIDQMTTYVEAIAARCALIVYVTTGTVVRVAGIGAT